MAGKINTHLPYSVRPSADGSMNAADVCHCRTTMKNLQGALVPALRVTQEGKTAVFIFLTRTQWQTPSEPLQ